MSHRRECSARWSLGLVCAASIAPTDAVQTSPDDALADLYQISLQDLMNMEVTSVSKKDQKLSQVAAAVFVINQEDIRRSGALNIPDLLRLVPGLDVAQINANTWAISARGFNHQFSDKLLVLIDGRAVYTPSQNGVNWDAQDLPLEDIDRIEVIRGPGATVWGTNAVNGVINVITKQAKDTPGALVTAGGGTQSREFGTAQYGGTIAGGGSYRIFTKYLNYNNLSDLTGGDGNDGWHLLHSGFRVDKDLATHDALTVQGDIYAGSEGAIIGHIVSISPPDNENVARQANLSGGNILGRWNHVLSSRSDTALQIYFDRYVRAGPELNEVCNTIDLDFQQHLRLSSRQDVVWGVEYNHADDQTVGTIDEAFAPADASFQLFSTFLQDEITLRPDRLFLTLGSKLEHNDFTGFEIEPSIRMSFTPTARDALWASVSNAARTPALRDDNADFNVAAISLPNGVPAVVTVLGNPQQKAEYVLAAELGYRVQASDGMSVDLSMFVNKYRNLRSQEPGAPTLQTGPVPYVQIPLVHGNRVHGMTAGLEVSAKLKVTDRWTLSPGYALLRTYLHADAGSQDTTMVPDLEGSSPRHQAQLRSAMSMSHRLSWDVSIYFVDRLPAQQLPSYTRLDMLLSWQPVENLELRLGGQNLLQRLHVESNDTGTSVNSSQVRRNAYGRVSWKF